MLKIKAHTFGCKETMWNIGEKAGLNDDALSFFQHALAEVEFDLYVRLDGSFIIISVNGVPLIDPQIWGLAMKDMNPMIG